ncbi:hypothetical protein [Luteimonas abyssi]|uniref:hypothetical protein n=1 Tax=Luteimonas abyssi TaxID=1247514 RepID=UPI000737CFBE|nr:hypothetical protein [Luteimonas abyssi]
MRRILLLLTLALVACTAQTDATGEHTTPPPTAPLQTMHPVSGDRLCNLSGGFEEDVCRYRLDEVEGIVSTSAILTRGYLSRDPNGLYASSDRDGTTNQLRIRVGALQPGQDDQAYIDALVGYLVELRGIYTPSDRTIEIRSLRWYEEPGVSAPQIPAPDGRREF